MPEKERKSDFRAVDRKLIAAFFTAVSGWFLHLNLSYMLMPESCENRSKLILHVVTAGCLLVTMAAAVVAWRTRAAFTAQPEEMPGRELTRWMATLIAALSVALSIVIVAQEIPNLILRSCD